MKPTGITVSTKTEWRQQQMRIVYYNRASQLEDGCMFSELYNVIHCNIYW